MFKIVADENIPYGYDSFSTVGRVTSLPAYEITQEVLRDADVLLTRSVLKVTRELLTSTPIHFVGTATIGTDHVDQEFLTQNSIAFSSAPGCNAQSVVEYVLTALIIHCSQRSMSLHEITLGIVGVGAIGSRLSTLAQSLGITVLLCDPPRAAHGETGFVSLQELLSSSNVVSVHVPLIEGEFQTFGMVNESFLAQLTDGALLINASRGKTLVTSALLNHAHRLSPYVLDVWPEEPHIAQDLIDCCQIATPHIAGYSFDGKVTGTAMLYDAFCQHHNLTPRWSIDQAFLSIPSLQIDGASKTLVEIVTEAYAIDSDDQRLRRVVASNEVETGFQLLRKTYPKRYEFSHWLVTGIEDSTLRQQLVLLGFTVS